MMESKRWTVTVTIDEHTGTPARWPDCVRPRRPMSATTSTRSTPRGDGGPSHHALRSGPASAAW